MFRLQLEDVELLTHESGGGAAPDETAPAPEAADPAPESVTTAAGGQAGKSEPRGL